MYVRCALVSLIGHRWSLNRCHSTLYSAELNYSFVVIIILSSFHDTQHISYSSSIYHIYHQHHNIVSKRASHEISFDFGIIRIELFCKLFTYQCVCSQQITRTLFVLETETREKSKNSEKNMIQHFAIASNFCEKRTKSTKILSVYAQI